jgi:hypothetical protein
MLTEVVRLEAGLVDPDLGEDVLSGPVSKIIALFCTVSSGRSDGNGSAVCCACPVVGGQSLIQGLAWAISLDAVGPCVP